MQFPRPLTEARLLRRYKRFLADVVLPDGAEVTIHCPNPGAMTGLAEPGMRVWIAPSRPGSKLAWGWKLAELPQGGMAVIDTSLANGVVAEALSAGLITGLPAFSGFRPEVRMDTDSRIDFCLTTAEGPFWLEVKSVTLARQAGLAEFPDSRTARGAKHLEGLRAARLRGEGAAMLYLLSRSACDRITIAGDIDPAYARAFAEARAAGVQMLGLACDISPEGVTARRMVPVI